MSFRIAVIGAQCTGKTTLAKLISEKLNLPILSEVARKFKKEQLSALNPEYPKIQEELLNLQMEQESLHKDFVSDRSTLDNLSYYLYGCADKVSSEDRSKYILRALSNADRYTYIFYLRPEFAIVEDNFRDCNPIYQMKIDTIINTILQLYNIHHYKITGSIEHRINKALEILNDSRVDNTGAS